MRWACSCIFPTTSRCTSHSSLRMPHTRSAFAQLTECKVIHATHFSSLDFRRSGDQRQVFAVVALHSASARTAARDCEHRGSGQAHRGAPHVTRVLCQTRRHAHDILRAAGDDSQVKLDESTLVRSSVAVDEGAVRNKPRQSLADQRRALGHVDASQLRHGLSSEQPTGAAWSPPLLLHRALHSVHAVPRQRHLSVRKRNVFWEPL